MLALSEFHAATVLLVVAVVGGVAALLARRRGSKPTEARQGRDDGALTGKDAELAREITRLHALKERGAVTGEHFVAEMQRLLRQGAQGEGSRDRDGAAG